jgi:hypothetical protein
MDRLEDRCDLFDRVVTLLEVAIVKFKQRTVFPRFYEEVYDLMIQRFEYSIDTFWKLVSMFPWHWSQRTASSVS